MKDFNMTRILSVFFIFFCCTQLFSQTQNVDFEKRNFRKDDWPLVKELIKEIEKGDEYFVLDRRATYLRALDFYMPVNNFNPNNALLNYKIGKCLLYSLQKTNSIFYLEKAERLNPEINSELDFLMGMAYHFNLEIDKAEEKYRKFISKMNSSETKEYSKIVNKKLEECKVARELIANPTRVIIENLGSKVNTIYPEYAPVINADESVIMFTSARDITVGGGIDPLDLYYYEDIYMSRNNGMSWTDVLHPELPLNTGYHDATVWLSADGQELIMYRGDNGGDLFVSKLNGDQWSEPVRFPSPINSKYHEPNASYTPDHSILYFVSDRPEGLGGHDIYYCTKNKKGRWNEPVNIGEPINTEYDETGVFIHPDGKTMFFCSQGHRTMGGFDIFKSTLDKGKWSEPENIGYPINSADDDVFLSITGSQRHGYYASYKPDGYGEKDIYKLTFLGSEKPLIFANEDNLLASSVVAFKLATAPAVEVQTSELTILKGLIRDEVTQQPVAANIEIVDNKQGTSINEASSNISTGKYLVALPSGKNYGIIVRADGYLFHSENVAIPASKRYQEITRDINLKKIEIGKKIVLRNIFFDFDKYSLRPESEAELRRLIALLIEMPKLKIEISGHTDKYGSAEYNKRLSENRSKAVVEYLVKNGIDAGRLTYKGYGPTQPIASNATDEGRQLNRRTEFKILAK